MKLGLEKIPQQLKTSSTEALVKSGNLNNSIESILKAINSIELKPEIKVNTPKLEIPAPIVNIPPIKIPEFPKKITADVNFSEVLSSLEELLTELTYLEQRGIHISNFGEAPVSVSIPTFRDVNGKVAQAILDANGYVKVAIQKSDANLENYQPADSDESTATKYYGFIDKDGNWYIFRDTGTTYRYVKGDSDYPTNWTNRSSLTYLYYNEIF